MNRYVGLIESINPIILQLQLKYALKNNFKVFLKGGSNMHYLISVYRSS